MLLSYISEGSISMDNQTKLYEGYLTNHYSHVRKGHSYKRKQNYLRKNYASLLPSNKQAKILDIGPGYGEFLELLHNELGFSNIQGIDLSAEVVNYCNSRLPNSCVLVTDSTEFLQSCEGQFDCIFMMHILEHVPKTATLEFLTALYRALKPDGYVVIEVPNMANPLTGLNIRYADFTHEVGYTEASLGYILKNVGFASITPFGSRLPFDSVMRIPQAIVRTCVNMLITLAYRGYASKRPQVIDPNLCMLAKKG